jgi:hypothetical protein
MMVKGRVLRCAPEEMEVVKVVSQEPEMGASGPLRGPALLIAV